MSTYPEAVQHIEQQREEVDHLLQTRLELVSQKRQATTQLEELDKKLIAIIGFEQEGSRTYDAGAFKVTTQGKLNRTVDEVKWAAIEQQIPEHLRPVRTKQVVDLKILRALEMAQPELYRWVCEALVTKPAKTSIKVQG
tara:strand:+ start:624 stop:1040 length:417 start_codon:yes stop_codon:yes gene_type:complete